MEPYCANCYAENPTKKCTRCKRRYCSKQCQSVDWKKKGHKFYCGRSGELGTDFEIRDSPDKQGVGVFALRDFKEADIIMVEKQVFQVNDLLEMSPEIMAHFLSMELDRRPDSVRAAVSKLRPPGGTLSDKLRVNVIGGSGYAANQSTNLMITMSRLNHSCLGNVCIRYVQHRDVEQVRATRDIKMGEEFTFCYTEPLGKDARQEILSEYGFVCSCKACTDPEMDRKLARLGDLKDAVVDAANNRKFDRMLVSTTALKQAYGELDGYLDKSSCHYPNLCDLFQAMMFLGKPLEECREVAREANAYAEVWLEEGDSQMEESRRRVADPQGLFKEKARKAYGPNF